MERDLNEKFAALQEHVPECNKALSDMMREATITGPWPMRWRDVVIDNILAFARILNVRYEEIEDWVRDIVGDHMTEFNCVKQGDMSLTREQWVLDFLYPYPLTTR